MNKEKIDKIVEEIERMQMNAKTIGGDQGLYLVKYNLKLLKKEDDLKEILLRVFEIGQGFGTWSICEKPTLGEWIELKQKIIKILEEVA